MPNLIDATGLQTATRQELVDHFTAAMQEIYGTDINLSSDSPDGQMMNIYIQAVLDLEDLLVQIYNQFDPDNAIGNVLDQRVAINGIQRQAGTFTVTPVTVVTSQSVNLYGLDQEVQAPYTVADNAGNRWVLQITQLGVVAGSHTYNFQGAVPGAQLTVPNTITVQSTIVLGVVSVNNPTTYTTLGVNEESDAKLKIRRQKSVSLASQGYYAALLAALENISGVTEAAIFENLTNVTDGDGVPGHTIWVVVSGSGAAADIAQAIYTKRNAGAGMFGDIDYVITQVDGSPFIVTWDSDEAENLFITFTTQAIDGIIPPRIDVIKAALVADLTPGINEEVNTNEVVTIVQSADPNCLVIDPALSTARTQHAALSALATSGAITFVYDNQSSPSISWNDGTSTIQTKIRTIPGLSAAVVTGDLDAAGALTFDLTGVGEILGLITVGTNSLLNSATPITLTFSEGYGPIVYPAVKKGKLRVSADNIIILPIVFTPMTSTVLSGNTQQFTAAGGYGSYTYSVSTNNSGGSINGSGVYTAGVSTGVTDTVKVVDAFGNFATATVSVP